MLKSKSKYKNRSRNIKIKIERHGDQTSSGKDRVRLKITAKCRETLYRRRVFNFRPQ